MAAASRSVKAHTAGPRAHRMSPRPAQIHRIPGPLCVLLGPRMWIVRLALRRPYTFVVVALLIVVLKAMGLPSHRAQNSIRFSLGASNTEEQIDHVIEILPRIVTKLRSLSAVTAR